MSILVSLEEVSVGEESFLSSNIDVVGISEQLLSVTSILMSCIEKFEGVSSSGVLTHSLNLSEDHSSFSFLEFSAGSGGVSILELE